MKLINNDCIKAMKEMPDNSVDSIVTDPPYELGFMGKSWDSTGIAFNVEVWQQALRVLKPGGHLIAFSGSRTYHRMAVAIEDAGFEIRDQIMWVYGSGFPKSLDVSKAIDKSSGENKNRQIKFVEWMQRTGITAKQINEATQTQMAGHYIGLSQPAIATADLFDKLRPYLPEVPEEIERLVAERTGIEWTAYKNREVVGTRRQRANSDNSLVPMNASAGEVENITAPSTPEAQQWQGWGTALKPAHEPMVLARKPIVGTVANNVLTYGVGGLNIDGSRVGSEGGTYKASKPEGISNGIYGEGINGKVDIGQLDSGRWPANFIHDGSDEVVGLFPDSKSTSGMKQPNNTNNEVYSGTWNAQPDKIGGFDDSGSAARFFYCAKTSKRDRNEGLDGFEAKEIAGKGNGLARTCASCGASTLDSCNCPDKTFIKPTRANFHPTVKPTDLMRYLCKLVTPPGGTILDPFMGSGSTGKGAVIEGFDFIGIEMNAEYIEIAKARIEHAQR